MENQLFLETSDNLLLKKDFFSYTFEKNTSVEIRHENGQYFTHKELVNLIIDRVKITQDSKVLDPTCGAGAFLIEALHKTSINNIYGVDIDKNALTLCEQNLISKSNIKSKNLFLGDFIKETFFKKEFFDVIIGNPPFKNLKSNGSDYNPRHPIYKEALSGVANSATLVLAKSYELLKEDGYLGFVLPKNFLRVDSFKNIRNLILNKTKIIEIIDVDHHFKDVRCDQILLIVQKKKLNFEEQKKHFVKITPYKKGIILEEQESYQIPQSEFFNYSFYPVFYSEETKKLADKLLTIDKNLNDYAQIYRGISISSSHNSLSKDVNLDKIKCYRGDSIKRFGLKYYLYLDKSKLQPIEKNKLEKLLKEKIVIQNIFSKEGGIYLNLSKAEEVSLNTVTNIIPNAGIDPYVLTGILGSRLSNLFIIYVLFLNSNFTMHTDKAYLGKIPIIIPEGEIKKQIQEYVKKLLKISDKYSKDFNETYAKLNQIIYQIYGLSKIEIEILEDLLRRVMSKKHG